MEVGVRLTGLILRLLNWLFVPLYWLINRGKEYTLPPINNPILLYGVEELATKIRSKELSSEQVVRAYIQRVQAVNPYINAVSEDRFSAALDEAKAADALIASGDSKAIEDKPLLGVPITIKESCSVAGLPNSVGCIENASSRATSDGGAVKLLKNAGAVPLLVSNTPEMCLGWETTNLIRGTTNNPYDGRRSAGGSSGGEAALVASAASPFGLVSDIAGSIRVPAAFCGLFGHKPTPGVVPISEHIPCIPDPNYPKFLSIGPMVRKASDLKYTLKVLAGDQAGKLNLDEPVDITKIRVYYMTRATTSWALLPTEPCIEEAIHKAVKYLKDCGATISEKKFEGLDDSVEISISVFFSMKDIPNMLQDPKDKHEKSIILEAIKCLIGLGTRSFQCLGFSFIQRTQLFIPESRRQHYHDEANKLREEIISSLGDSGVLVTPAFSSRAPPHGALWTRASGVLYSMVHNVLGLPAAVVPAATTALPAALQVIAAPHQDRLCLAVAEKLEAALGGWQPPP